MSAPPTGDRGQRYMVTFYDPDTKTRRTLGWANTVESAEAMVRCVKAHPSWRDPVIDDRKEPR